MSVEAEVRELKEQVEQLTQSQATTQSMLAELLDRLQSGSGAGSPGPPQLDEDN